MPWKEHRALDLREEFVLKAKAPGANISALCREYGISRKTGHKWLARFESGGPQALRELSRRPHQTLNATDGELVLQIIEARHAHPRWGPKKLRAVLMRKGVSDVPTVRTIARILLRAGEPLVRPRRHRNASVAIVPLSPSPAQHANELWTVDFKGWWRTRDGKRCEPLTVRDGYSRFVLCAKMLATTRRKPVQDAFERLFQQYGLPEAIQMDNGPPFASTRARGGLTVLSAWWVSLGILQALPRPAPTLLPRALSTSPSESHRPSTPRRAITLRGFWRCRLRRCHPPHRRLNRARSLPPPRACPLRFVQRRLDFSR